MKFKFSMYLKMAIAVWLTNINAGHSILDIYRAVKGTPAEGLVLWYLVFWGIFSLFWTIIMVKEFILAWRAYQLTKENVE